MVLADDKFVDLDEIVPETEITTEPARKREQPQQKLQQQSVPQTLLQEKVIQTAKVEKQEQKPIQKQDTKSVQKTVQKEAQKSVGKVAQKPVKNAASHKIKHAPKKFSKIDAEKSTLLPKKKESTIQLNSVQKSKSKEKSTNWVLISLIILAVIAVGVILFVIFHSKGVAKDSVVALINGQPIYKSEITSRYNLMVTTMNPLITEEQVLNMSITDKLLLQEADKKGIVVSDQEVNDVLQGVMKTNNIDDAALRADLKAKNLTYEYVFKLYKDTLTINKLLNSSFMNETVTEEDIQAFYDKNKALLVVPDMVQVRHILLQFSNVSENETYAAAKIIFDKIDANKSNFCELVKAYTDDKSSANTCGEYNFSKTDSLVPEFLNAGFSMKPGDVEIVKTQFGYHIMYKVADMKGYTPDLDSIRPQIETAVKQQKAVDKYKIFVDGLWNSASIEIYNDGVLVNKYGPASFLNNSVDGESQVATANQINVDAAANQSVQTTIQPTVTTQVAPETPQSILAKCLTMAGAKVFVASWSPDAQNQFLLFGDAKTYLTVVECDPENAAANLTACNAALKKQYPTWPTWQINDVLIEGVQSLSALAKESGCSYAS